MKPWIRTAAVAATAVAITAGAAGCSKTATESAPQSAPETKTEAPVNKSTTIQDYIKDNNITETAIKRSDSGVPVIGLPFPPGWVDAGANTPAWSFGAILYATPQDPNNPPNIIAAMSKLTGNVDPAKILEFAPNEMRNKSGFAPISEPVRLKISGFDAVEASGTYVMNNAKRAIVQDTVVIPTQGGVYVIQLNADAPEAEKGVVIDAMKVINTGTQIKP
ncbi:MAG: LpqN/LpqT family lipoprotein [Mycobacteriaceae bacterium]